MWPRDEIERVVNALAGRGEVILGLDLRSDGENSTPSELATEVPWFDYTPGPSSGVAKREGARRQALEALRHPGLADLDEYSRVLVTW
jgi:hypothetical protein